MHQGTASSTLLFMIVIKEAKRNCSSMASSDMHYADDFVIFAQVESQSIKSLLVQQGFSKTLFQNQRGQDKPIDFRSKICSSNNREPLLDMFVVVALIIKKDSVFFHYT